MYMVIIGSLHKIGLMGTENSIMEGANIPEMAFIAFQCMFAIITPAIMSGSITGRMRFCSICDICHYLVYINL